MEQPVDFANLTNRQRVNIFKQVAYKRNAWLNCVFADLAKKGDLPQHIWFWAASNEHSKKEAVKSWLKENGFEVIPLDGQNDMGAVLKRRGKVIAELEIKVEQRATLKSEGNTGSETINPEMN
jgi:hypothetical protein